MGRNLHRFVILVVALCALTICAQAQSPANYADALHAIPRPAGRVSTCSTFRPDGQLAVGAGGVTDLSIHITADGTVSGANLLVSSGDPRFDAAAVACANEFFIQPATKDGVRIDVDWVGRVDWRRPAPNTYLAIALQDETRRICLNYPDLARRLSEEGITALTFDVAPDGSTRNFVVVLSSGYGDLDAAAVACFSGYQYFPPTLGGRPIEIGWRGVQGFRLN